MVTLHAVALLSAALFVGAFGHDDSDVLKDVSFMPPFKTYDVLGKRRIENFVYGGDAELNQNFLRLTPDRAVCSPCPVG